MTKRLVLWQAVIPSSLNIYLAAANSSLWQNG